MRNLVIEVESIIDNIKLGILYFEMIKWLVEIVIMVITFYIC